MLTSPVEFRYLFQTIKSAPVVPVAVRNVRVPRSRAFIDPVTYPAYGFPPSAVGILHPCQPTSPSRIPISVRARQSVPPPLPQRWPPAKGSPRSSAPRRSPTTVPMATRRGPGAAARSAALGCWVKNPVDFGVFQVCSRDFLPMWLESS